MKRTSFLAGFILSLVILPACSTRNSESTFDPDTGRHINDWPGIHWSYYLRGMDQCADCHGAAFDGGISKVSCYTVSNSGITCHGGTGWQHLSVWGNPDLHGQFAKSVPSAFSGFAHCTTCHGSNFTGGTGNPAPPACLNNGTGCHDNTGAPHAVPWVESPRTHTTTDQGNAPVCAGCHRQNTGAPGCFNNTLCHGSPG